MHRTPASLGTLAGLDTTMQVEDKRAYKRGQHGVNQSISKYFYTGCAAKIDLTALGQAMQF